MRRKPLFEPFVVHYDPANSDESQKVIVLNLKAPTNARASKADER